MIGLLLLASSAAATPLSTNNDPASLAEAAHAIHVGRLEQAKIMIGRAVAAGSSGAPVQRLIADLSFATGQYADAVKDYQALLAGGYRDRTICENAAIAALNAGLPADAKPLAECAISSPAASWRAWNAYGTLADLGGDWPTADRSYAKAAELSPGRAEMINNEGWSHVLRGEWATALPFFEDASKRDPGSQRIANNLELVRAALASELPSRRAGESTSDWAARLNDAGVAAQLLGDKKRALSAFTQALYASGRWYPRAAENLEMAKRP
jgi:Flp pilus assembly protein TadD